MEITFRIGDTVQRKTGGQDLLVSNAAPDRITCQSYNQSNASFDERTFEPDELKLVRKCGRVEPIEVDDWVAFKLGSVDLLVREVSPGKIRCAWHVQATNEDRSGEFAPELLVVTRPREDQEDPDLVPIVQVEEPAW